MTEKIMSACLGLVMEKFPNIPADEAESYADDIYERLVHSIFMKAADLLENDKLEEMEKLLEGPDEPIFDLLEENLDVDSIFGEAYKEMENLYLK